MKIDIQRNQSTYVYRSETHRSGWDADIVSGYAAYLLHGTTPVDILTTGYALCKTRMTALLGADLVALSFHPSDNKTNGKIIFVSTEVVDNADLSPIYKLDVLLGATTHEVAHVLYSDFTQEFKSKFHSRIMNIIEDEAIEHRIGESFPGLASQLGVLKNYYFDYKYTIHNPVKPAEELFDCFFKMIRYPKHLNKRLVRKHRKALKRIQQILSPYPLTHGTLYEASCLILEVFQSYTEGEAEGPENEFEKIATKTDFLTPTSADLQAMKVSETIDKDEMTYQIVTAKAEYVPGSKTYFVKGTASTQAYLSIKQQVIGAARKLASLLAMDKTDEIVVEQRMPEGTLDESMLVEAICGTKNIYSVKSFAPATDPRVVLAMDESGSMDDKIKSLRQAAVIVREALTMVRGQLFAYGYTSDQHTNDTNTITVYAEPGLKAETAMASIDAKCSNRDGVCLQEIGTRVRRFSSERMLMIVISDGAPTANGYIGDLAIEHTRSVVEQLGKDGFLVVQIGIDIASKEDQARMFKNYVNYTDSHDMVNQLCQLLRPLLLKLHNS